ncbi:MAG: hypothetical protein IJB74_08010 [Clostridia bacterium]|nr:hypothetical protein [Clostridia bacterium]
MTPYGIVYKDTVASLNEGAEIWRKNLNKISKKYFILSYLLISASVVAVNFAILCFRTEKDIYIPTTVLITLMEIISLYFLLISVSKRNAKNIFLSTNSNKSFKQAVIRENDMEFSTPYSKSNYFYEEIDKVVEGIFSLNIYVEEGNLPVCISKNSVEKGDIDMFISLLREKIQDRYIYEKSRGVR